MYKQQFCKPMCSCFASVLNNLLLFYLDEEHWSALSIFLLKNGKPGCAWKEAQTDVLALLTVHLGQFLWFCNLWTILTQSFRRKKKRNLRCSLLLVHKKFSTCVAVIKLYSTEIGLSVHGLASIPIFLPIDTNPICLQQDCIILGPI